MTNTLKASARKPDLLQTPDTHYRLVPSHFPPIHLFEHLLDADELDAAYALESLTNARLLDEAGNIRLVPPGERLVGAGSTPIMAAFTHLGPPSRFSDGSYGVYYAGLTLETAIAETIFRREKFLAATSEKACTITMRAYTSRLVQPLHDIRGNDYHVLHDPNDYSASQLFAKHIRAENSWGLHYRSVRKVGGECIALFRPRATKPARQGGHYAYRWDGLRITDVMQLKRINLE
jgi:hypothetical protein